MKILIQSLFFLLLITQICFAQWVQVGLNDKSIKDIAVKDSIIFAIILDSGKVYGSIDNGGNWTTVVDSCAVDVEISLSGKVFMTKDSVMDSLPPWSPPFLFSSIDNGDTWTPVNMIEQLKDSLYCWWICRPKNIAVSPEGIIFCQIVESTRQGPYDVLAKSVDDGLNWTTPGTRVIAGKLFDFENQFVITLGVPICCSGPLIHLSSDYGNTWTFIGYTPYASNTLSYFPNGNILVGGEDALYISNDMCSTWEQISTLNCQIGLTLTNGSTEGILIGTDSLGVFVFSDEGDSLGSRNDGLTNLNVQALTLDDHGYVYAGTGNGVWRRPLFEVIPVELISFSATSNASEVTLIWSTATETNNSGFSIERKSNNSEYSEIGFVPGFGTTTERKSYSFTDSKVSIGKYTYRIKQMDFDGSFEYSPEVEVEIAAPLTFSLEQNYPNPFNPGTTIKYSIPKESKVKLTLFNLLGEELMTLVNEEEKAGNYTLEINATSLPSGVYFYQLKAGNYMDTKKMMLLK